MPPFSGSAMVTKNWEGLYAYLKGRSDGDQARTSLSHRGKVNLLRAAFALCVTLGALPALAQPADSMTLQRPLESRCTRGWAVCGVVSPLLIECRPSVPE